VRKNLPACIIELSEWKEPNNGRHKDNIFPSYERDFRTLSLVDEENILQACATVFAGVLILLTLERRFEVKDVEPEYIDKLESQRKEISSYLERLQTERTKKIEFITEQKKKYKEDKTEDISEDMRFSQVEADLARLEQRLEKAQNDLRLTDATLKQVREQQMVSKEEEVRAQRLKDVEDLMTLITLALFSLCIVFMIFVDRQWSYYVFSYSAISKFLFSLALAVLLVRVYLRKELRTPRRPFLGKI
jgi:hypothetical protein